MDRKKQALSCFCDTSAFTLNNPEYKKLVDWYLFSEMERDSGSGDITTQFCLQGKSQEKTAVIRSKAQGIFVGEMEISYFLDDLSLAYRWHVHDGELVAPPQILLEITGDAGVLLRAERVILNLIGRLSGIATMMAKCVQEVPETVLVCPTRKTLWGLLDKRACVSGGGGTHRLHASSAILIKENHWTLFPERSIASLKPLLHKASTDALGKFVEIEVENEEEAHMALDVLSALSKDAQGVIMFDNFSPIHIKPLVADLKGKNDTILFEASGGITLNNITSYGETGVDILSLGTLTHSVMQLDVSMRIE